MTKSLIPRACLAALLLALAPAFAVGRSGSDHGKTGGKSSGRWGSGHKGGKTGGGSDQGSGRGYTRKGTGGGGQNNNNGSSTYILSPTQMHLNLNTNTNAYAPGGGGGASSHGGGPSFGAQEDMYGVGVPPVGEGEEAHGPGYATTLESSAGSEINAGSPIGNTAPVIGRESNGSGPTQGSRHTIMGSSKRRGGGGGSPRTRPPAAPLPTVKDFKKALAGAEAATAASPRNPAGHVRKAEALNKLGRYGEAELAALVAIQRSGKRSRARAEAYRELGWAQLNMGRYRDAVISTTKSLAINPNDPNALAARAFAYEALGRREKMIADLEAAARLDPKFENHVRLARAGKTLFKPNAKDSWKLLEALEGPKPPRQGPRLGALAGGLLLLVGIGLAGALVLRPVLKARTSSTRMPLDETPAEKPSPKPVQARPRPEAKDLLGGKYQMLRMVGRGGTGQVWEAYDHTLQRSVAVKKMSAENVTSDKVRDAYLKEARRLGSLDHPGIARLFEMLNHPSGLHLVFELVTGKNVEKLLEENKRVPFPKARELLRTVCGALESGHAKGIAHRDLKLSSIVLTEAGVKLLDFGLSYRLSLPTAAQAPASRTGLPSMHTVGPMSGGPPPHLAPETARGSFTPAADVYSLGFGVYRMLTGSYPFRVGGVRREYVQVVVRAPGLDARLDDAIRPCLEEDAAKRPTPRQFLTELEAIRA